MSWGPSEPAVLILEDGTSWKGQAIGKVGMAGGELCFNTGMTGYQEVFTDPSYAGQILIMTAAHIGNYGVRFSESQSDRVQPGGIVISHFSADYSRALADASLDEFLIEHQVVGIAGVDTRALVCHIREKGAMNAVIASGIEDEEEVRSFLAALPSMQGLALAEKVSVTAPYVMGDAQARWRVAVVDLGVKRNILHSLVREDCHLKVFPADVSYAEMMEWAPHGVLFSNGPGDPAPLRHVQALAKGCIENNIPTMGICLGHQVIALAMGISTYKMHIGHRGLNHPVRDLRTGKAVITSQNHGFGVSRAEVEAHPRLQPAFINLNDDSLEGLVIEGRPVISVQFHPEAAPGPHDTLYLFHEFVELMAVGQPASLTSNIS